MNDSARHHRHALRHCGKFALTVMSTLFTFAAGFASCTAYATEGGGNSYPIGVETNFPGMMLPEGLSVMVYYSNYAPSHSKDNAGNDNAKLAYYKLKANTFAGRLTYVWPGVRWLGANVETRAVLALPSLDLSLGVARPAPLGPLDRSGDRMSFADFSFAPVVLGWHGEKLHQTIGIETFLGTGSYNVNRRINTGRNYDQVAPAYALTWLPLAKVDASVKLRYAFNGRNKDTNYRSGNEFTAEYSGGYRFSPEFAAGLSGYMYRQTTDDMQNGLAVNGNGNRGFVNALGPYITVTVAPKVMITAKLQTEFGARNKAEGTRFWLQTRLPF